MLLTKHRIGPHNIDILSVFIGSMLGDGHAEKRGGSTRFTFKYGGGNAEYIQFLQNFFIQRGYCADKEMIKTRVINKKIGKTFYSYRFRTWSYCSLNWLYDMFYINKIKRIPDGIDQWLTPQAWAIWAMDDGGRDGGGFSFATQCFSKIDVIKLQQAILKNFGILCSIQNLKRKVQHITTENPEQFYHRLYIKKADFMQFREIVSPYFHVSMLYKLKINEKEL